jgi:hypothetical protein
MDSLPGMNQLAKGPGDSTRKLEFQWQPLRDRKIIVIATSTIHDSTLFVNGLYQNIFILYKLFDAMGYAPILLVNDKPKGIDKVPSILRNVRMISVDEISQSPIPIYIYLEIGMSIDPALRRVFKMGGARIVKLYLGNILNIDIETPIFYPSMHFSHHIVGEMDEIWVSPHYKQHDEYAAIINHVNPGPKSLRIAPYVWDPCILTLDGSRNLKWRPRNKNETETIVILEPNISFQKTSLIPLLIAERNYRENKRHLQVIVGNSERLLQNPFFMKTIMPTLELAKDNKIHFDGRFSITEIMTQYPHCTAICHQLNNQYNYMTLEYITAGFPLVHNAPDWYDVGYYYKGNDPVAGATALLSAQVQHENSQEKYKSGAEAIRWRHSPYNPEMQKAWKEILG